jgi:hypothetical protein
MMTGQPFTGLTKIENLPTGDFRERKTFDWAWAYSVISNVLKSDDDQDSSWLMSVMTADGVGISAHHMHITESYPSVFDVVFNS